MAELNTDWLYSEGLAFKVGAGQPPTTFAEEQDRSRSIFLRARPDIVRRLHKAYEDDGREIPAWLSDHPSSPQQKVLLPTASTTEPSPIVPQEDFTGRPDMEGLSQPSVTTQEKVPFEVTLPTLSELPATPEPVLPQEGLTSDLPQQGTVEGRPIPEGPRVGEITLPEAQTPLFDTKAVREADTSVQVIEEVAKALPEEAGTNPIDWLVSQGLVGLDETDPEHQKVIQAFINENVKGLAARPSDVARSYAAWCAAFVDHVLRGLGEDILSVPTSGKADTESERAYNRIRAKRYLEYGSEVKPEDAKSGDIVVVRSGTQYHVAFFYGFDEDGNYLLLGGNQGGRAGLTRRSTGQVNVAAYSPSRVQGVRRIGDVTKLSPDTVKQITEDMSVLTVNPVDVQARLNQNMSADERKLVVDGVFGKRSQKALKDFQKKNNLKETGVVDWETFKALGLVYKGPLLNSSTR